jgi:hypothetical protein
MTLVARQTAHHPMRADALPMALLCVVVLVQACGGSDADLDAALDPAPNGNKTSGLDATEPAADTSTSMDSAGDDRASRDADEPPDAALADVGPPPCPTTLSDEFVAQIRPYLEPCMPCHNLDVPAEHLHSAGPQWFAPNDASETVEQLLERGLVNPLQSSRSLFRLKPLTRIGVSHQGGDHFLPGSDMDLAFLEFLRRAVPCAPDAPPIPGFP